VVSVLFPVYNQYDELALALDALNRQDYLEPFEVVVVDDKSAHIPRQVIDRYSTMSRYSLVFAENPVNMGRAATRNILLDKSHGDILIFCDADRFPHGSFIKDHIECLDTIPRCISIGKVMETYESVRAIQERPGVACVSRKAVYYKTIQKLFDDAGRSDSGLVWLATLSGNLAIRREDLRDERFDESFREWGFEHFELGYRLVQKGLEVVLNKGAINTHIAHPRNTMDYENCIEKSYAHFYAKYPGTMVQYLRDFILGNISLQEYELLSSGQKIWMQGKKPIYNMIINM
jgi:GT2 family glycosyltransferase